MYKKLNNTVPLSCSGNVSLSTIPPFNRCEMSFGSWSHGICVTPSSTFHKFLNSDSLMPTPGAHATFSWKNQFRSHLNNFYCIQYT